MPIAHVNEQHLYYRDTGQRPNDGPVVLCSHGFLMGHEMWRPQIAALMGEYRCIAYDERGWGQSRWTEPFTYWDMADDAVALLDHLDVERAVFMGMSQGGFLSLRAALRHPERVQALVLVDSSSEPHPPEASEGFGALYQQMLTDGWTDEAGEIVTGALFGSGFDPSYWVGKWLARHPSAWQAAITNLFERDGITDRLAEITCPTLVIHGDADAALPYAEGQLLADTIPNSKPLVTIPGAGHTANLEAPDLVNAAIAEFLSTLS